MAVEVFFGEDSERYKHLKAEIRNRIAGMDCDQCINNDSELVEFFRDIESEVRDENVNNSDCP